ncbi:MAG TPA: TIGR04282 family arsenosugar biosynthesis glycosyltransferase [Burkholderiales bacterium]|jgi:rSAM/selenodomain-associated transferase 1|nr:TIGR04282 family arsenosugar biosynthesis glycosyltransferase [Burkholderiales bacterium]
MPVQQDSPLIVFARAPVPGQVKTRLVPLLGAEGAAALHVRLAKHALGTARKASFAQTELHCAPDAEDPFFRFCAGHYKVAIRPQAEGDLGARMHAAFERALVTCPRALLIGSDCPALTARHLRHADQALRDGADAVLVPCEDGGYALIGLARADRRLFEDIAWGGETVMAETRRRLAALGWQWRELETLWDVDRPEDYQRLLASGLLDVRREEP